MSPARSLAAAVALAAAAAPIPIRSAETLAVLAVDEPPGPSRLLIELTAQLRAVLAEQAAGVIGATELRQRMVGRAPTASLSQIERALAGAQATYQAGDYDGAIRALRATVQDAEKLPDSEQALAKWTRAMLRLARAEQTTGQRAECQATVARLVRTNPAVRVDPNLYPPSFAKLVEDALSDLARQPRRRLTVTARQKVPTVVYLDGRQVGPAPVTLELVAGRYRVSGATQGARIPGVVADLSEADQTVALDAALAAALRPDAGPGLAIAREGRALRIISAAEGFGLDRVVATTLVVEGDATYLQGTVYDIGRGVTGREARLRLMGRRHPQDRTPRGAPPPGGLAALSAFLLSGQPSALVSEVGRAPPAPETPATTFRRW